MQEYASEFPFDVARPGVRRGFGGAPRLSLGAEPNGLTSAQVRRIVADIDQAADIVGFTIAEFIPGR